MKRLVPLLLLLLLLGGCTGGCRDTEATVTESPAASALPEVEESRPPEPSAVLPVPTASLVSPTVPVTSAEPSAEPSATPAAEPEPTATAAEDVGPDDETVLAAYRSAVEAFWWFQVETLPLDMADSREVDGQTYYRVDYPGIDSTASLRGYLKNLFSDDLVEMLLPYDGVRYIDVDGALYGLEGGRGTDVTRGAESAQVLREGDPNRRVVRVTVEVVDPEQEGAVVDMLTFDFPYEKVGEKWIFTSFSLAR